MSKHNYALGTQEQLDAAKDDATKIPFDTVFLYRGEEVIRNPWFHDDEDTVYMSNVEYYGCPLEQGSYRQASDLLPAKKKQKKEKRIPWQNGTQEDLDNAKGNALKIPKKTYFLSKYGDTAGMVVYRIDAIGNDSADVLMYNFGMDRSQFMTAEELEPIGC